MGSIICCVATGAILGIYFFLHPTISIPLPSVWSVQVIHHRSHLLHFRVVHGAVHMCCHHYHLFQSTFPTVVVPFFSCCRLPLYRTPNVHSQNLPYPLYHAIATPFVPFFLTKVRLYSQRGTGLLSPSRVAIKMTQATQKEGRAMKQTVNRKTLCWPFPSSCVTAADAPTFTEIRRLASRTDETTSHAQPCQSWLVISFSARPLSYDAILILSGLGIERLHFRFRSQYCIAPRLQASKYFLS